MIALANASFDFDKEPVVSESDTSGMLLTAHETEGLGLFLCNFRAIESVLPMVTTDTGSDGASTADQVDKLAVEVGRSETVLNIAELMWMYREVEVVVVENIDFFAVSICIPDVSFIRQDESRLCILD